MKLHLHDYNFITEGGYRKIYCYPDNDNYIIKIDKNIKKPLNFLNKNYISNIPNLIGNLSQREMLFLKQSKIKKNIFFPNFKCFVKTNLGYGLVVEKIKNYDGSISCTLKDYVLINGITNEIKVKINELKNNLIKNKIYVYDLHSCNVLVQYSKKDHINKLVIIDGYTLFTFDLNKLFNNMKTFNKKYFKKWFDSRLNLERILEDHHKKK